MSSDLQDDAEVRMAIRHQPVSDHPLAIVSGPPNGASGQVPYIFFYGRHMRHAEAKLIMEQGKRPEVILKFDPGDVEFMNWQTLVERRDAQAKAYREAQDAARASATVPGPAEYHTDEEKHAHRIPADDENDAQGCGCGACGIDH